MNRSTPQRLRATVGIALFTMAPIAPAAMAHSLEEFEGQLLERESYVEVTNDTAPAFTLTDAEGHSVSRSDFADKVVVLYFAYARCKELCPLQNDYIASIQEQINAMAKRDHVQFVTIVTDTEDALETAEIIRGFPRRHGFDTSNWIVLYRGSLEPDATIKLAERYGVKFSYTEEGDQLHGVVTYLVDRQGVLRARYHGLNFDPANFVNHVNVLTNDRHDNVAGRGAEGAVSVADALAWAGRNQNVIVAAAAGILVLAGIGAAAQLYRRFRR